MGVSKSRGRSRRPGLFFFLFVLENAVLGLELGLTLTLNLTQTLKQHSLKKKIDTDPSPNPAFYWHLFVIHLMSNRNADRNR